MYQIGQFSIIVRLSVKALRYYHEEGVLIPDYIDEDSGYRYYSDSSVERAKVVTMLRELDFSMAEIKDILNNHSEDHEIIDFLEAQLGKMEENIKRSMEINERISSMIHIIKESEIIESKCDTAIIEKTVDDIIFAGYRFKGKYSDVGKAFQVVGKAGARHIAGKAMTLYHDGEYKENDADIEGGFPLSRSISGGEVKSRILNGGKAVTIIHKGSYELLGDSYEKIFNYIEQKKYRVNSPIREVYIKGPGMVFKGKPEKYITEIQFIVT